MVSITIPVWNLIGLLQIMKMYLDLDTHLKFGFKSICNFAYILYKMYLES